MVGTIIVGGGKSNRFGQDKISYLINGKPLIYYSIIPFIKSKFIDKIVVVLSEKNYNNLKDFLKKLTKVQDVVIGGEERKNSVIKGLECFLNKNIDKVLIHDGARPNLKIELIDKIIDRLNNFECVIPVINPKETIKMKKEDKIITLDRNSLYLTQTPQGFAFPKIYNLLIKYINHNLYDDSTVFELEGEEIDLIEGYPENIKVTYSFDILLIMDYINKNEDRYRI